MPIKKNPHEWSHGKLEVIDKCPVCGTNDKKGMIFERHNNEGTMPDIWKMIQCADCNSIWLYSRPDNDSLPNAYKNYYTHSADKEEKSKNNPAWKIIHGYLDHRFKIKNNYSWPIGHTLISLIEPWRLKLDYYGRHLSINRVGTPGKLLDIGCGNGTFLQRAINMGRKAQGCEVDPLAVEACRKIKLDVIKGDVFHPSLTGKKFDVITMRHVIEHVTDQPLLLQRAFDLLCPGGWLWIALPNPQSVGLRTFGAAWNALHPPCHLIIPSQAVLSKWLGEIGFYNVQRLRRGAHARSEWELSSLIAYRESIAIPSTIRRTMLRLFADTLATISPKWSEESVFLARKPK